jgi:hypothetical protein
MRFSRVRRRTAEWRLGPLWLELTLLGWCGCAGAGLSIVSVIDMVAALCVSTYLLLTLDASTVIRNAVPVVSKTPRLVTTRLTTARPVSGGVQAVSRINLQLRSLCRHGAAVSRTASIPTSHGPAPVLAFAIGTCDPLYFRHGDGTSRRGSRARMGLPTVRNHPRYRKPRLCQMIRGVLWVKADDLIRLVSVG